MYPKEGQIKIQEALAEAEQIVFEEQYTAAQEEAEEAELEQRLMEVELAAAAQEEAERQAEITQEKIAEVVGV